MGADSKSQEGPYHLIAPCLGTPESVISLEHASIMALRRKQILSPRRAPTISIAPHLGTPELTIYIVGLYKHHGSSGGADSKLQRGPYYFVGPHLGTPESWVLPDYTYCAPHRVLFLCPGRALIVLQYPTLAPQKH